MKIKHIFLSVAVAALALSSCSKVLDTAPDGKLTYDEIFADNDKVGGFLNSCYANIPAGAYQYYFWTNWFTGSSDEAYDNDADGDGAGMVNNRMYNGSASASSHPMENGWWEGYWNAIWKCSYFLSRIETATVTNEADRSRWTAEAHVLRAYYYMKMLQLFGPRLAIEDKPFDMDQDVSQLRYASYKDIAEFVYKDCDAAIDNADLPWRITTDAEKQRVTKAVAWAIKSRVALYAASPLNNPTGDVELWKNAYDITKKAYEEVSQKGYELYKVSKLSEYTGPNAYITPEGYPANAAAAAAAINEYFCEWHDYGGGRDLETIWEDRNGNGQIWNVAAIGCQGPYKSGPCPTQEMADAFPTLKGNYILNLEKPYLDEVDHLQPNITPEAAAEGYTETDPYAVFRDPRFYTSLYYHGSKRYCEWPFAEGSYPSKSSRMRVIDCSTSDIRTGSDITVSTDKQRERTRTGYYTRKWLSPNKGASSDNNNAPGFKHFRFAELLMNYAEAAAEYGELGEARFAVNEIRKRAAMPTIETTDQAKLIREIRNERRIEFAFEEQRFFDMRRWTKPDGDLANTMKYVTAMKIVKNGDKTTYERVHIRANGYQCYTNKFLWVALPLAEAARLESLTGQNWQNPGW